VCQDINQDEHGREMLEIACWELNHEETLGEKSPAADWGEYSIMAEPMRFLGAVMLFIRRSHCPLRRCLSDECNFS